MKDIRRKLLVDGDFANYTPKTSDNYHFAQKATDNVFVAFSFSNYSDYEQI